MALVASACIWEGPQPSTPPGAFILNATDEPITVFFRLMTETAASPEQIDAGEERDVVTVRPGECAGRATSHSSVVVYEVAYRDRFSGSVNETDMATEPAFEMDLDTSPMCDGEVWTWDGQSLQPPDR